MMFAHLKLIKVVGRRVAGFTHGVYVWNPHSFRSQGTVLVLKLKCTELETMSM
jgi:hypothetical protein